MSVSVQDLTSLVAVDDELLASILYSRAHNLRSQVYCRSGKFLAVRTSGASSVFERRVVEIEIKAASNASNASWKSVGNSE